MFCPACGQSNPERSRTCGGCGSQMPGADTSQSLKGVVPINTSGWAIAAGYLGLFSLILIAGPLALATGVIALRHLAKNPGMLGHVRAWVGIVMGSLGTLGLVLMVVSLAR